MVTVEKGSVTEKAIAVGQIQPRQKFSVKSKISGIVRRCLVQVGDRVQPGQTLFEIAPDPTPQELTDVDRQLDSAQASFQRAKADFERAVELSQDGRPPEVRPRLQARGLRAREDRGRAGRTGPGPDAQGARRRRPTSRSSRSSGRRPPERS